VRIAAVYKIVKILDEYPVRNVLGLWAEASDLLLPEKPAETAEVGYKLLRSCAALQGLSTVERNVLFMAACLRQGNSHLDLRLDIISTLTNGGRNIEACEALIAPFILGALDTAFKESRNAVSARRKAQTGKKAPLEPIKESENMTKLFQYAIDVCKFNSKLFTDDDLEMLLTKTMSICQMTTQHADIENAIRLFDTVITYVHIPVRALKPCLEVLCSIHRQLADLQEQTWNTLSNLFKSHFGQAAVSALLHTLLDGSNRATHQYSYYRGAIQVLQLLLLEDGRAGLPKVPMSVLIPALKASIKDEHATQEAFVLSLIAAVLAEERIRLILLRETNWRDLLDIIRICSGRDDIREAAKSAGGGLRLTADNPSVGGAASLAAGKYPFLRNCTGL
jgi:hypothetical protein